MESIGFRNDMQDTINTINIYVHVIKGMVDCLGDMRTVMVKLHEQILLSKLSFDCTTIIIILKEELDQGATNKTWMACKVRT